MAQMTYPDAVLSLGFLSFMWFLTTVAMDSTSHCGENDSAAPKSLFSPGKHKILLNPKQNNIKLNPKLQNKIKTKIKKNPK